MRLRFAAWLLALFVVAPALAQEADLYVTKSADREVVQLDQFIEWTIEAGNYGPLEISGVIVEDTLPDGVTVVELDNECSEHPSLKTVLECNFSLQSSETKSIRIVARVDQAPVLVEGIPPEVTNSVSISSLGEEWVDPDMSNNSASVGTRFVTHVRVVETVGVVDSVFVLPPVDLVIAELVLVNDASVATPPFYLTVSESILANDQVGAVQPISVLVNESIVANDSISTVFPTVLLVSETITVRDAVGVLTPISLLVSETIVANDKVNTASRTLIMITESIQVSDFVATANSSGPQVLFVRPIAGQCGPALLSGSRLSKPVTELEIAFSEPMNASVTESVGAGNIANYRLVRTETPTGQLPANCSAVLPVGAIEQTIEMYRYDSAEMTTVLRSPSLTGLGKAYYKLMVCSGGLQSEGAVNLDGDANNVAGGDYGITFSVDTNNRVANPNFSGSAGSWTLTGATSFSESDADLAILAGSVLIDTTEFPSNVGQCVILDGVGQFGLEASFMGSTNASLVWSKIDYFEKNDCSGSASKSTSIQHQVNKDSWVSKRLKASAPKNTKSAWISFENTKGSTSVYVDSVDLSRLPEVIFSDGFESLNAGNGAALD